MLTATYHAPLGDIELVAGERGLAGLWFVDAPPRDADELVARAARLEVRDAESGGAACAPSDPADAASAAVLRHAWGWLNAYFAGQRPRWVPPMHFESTEFVHGVAAEVLSIEFAHAVPVDRLAEKLAVRAGAIGACGCGRVLSARSVADALASIPVRLVIPTHRVLTDVESQHAAELREFEMGMIKSVR